ncbi:MAG: 4Fe-4S binding protein [Deltaproteobacteria bacterium]|nr:4Fe-4S binding protein [Deltaproteobacteria bacterium]
MQRLINYFQNINLTNIQIHRRIVQYLFLATTVFIGVQFSVFVNQLESGILPTVSRPPGIEAFLPISSLISLKYWLLTGTFTRVHPSGLIILLIILSTAILLKRGFCSWVCPFGLLTEYLNRLHHFIFRKNIRIPRWLDYPLRSLKYLLLAFFLWEIVIKMNAFALDYFIYSPYNMVADIKMLYFFKNISAFALWVLAALVILSILIRNFWCRYLCPYGALLGALSLLSIFKVHRTHQTCTNCRQCTRACPADIRLHKTTTVMSDECHACLKCVSACPEKNTLYLSSLKKNGVMKPWIYVVTISLLFLGGSLLAGATGYWQTGISNNEYLFHVRNLHLPLYQHRGQVPAYNKDAWLKMMAEIRTFQGTMSSDHPRGKSSNNDN